MNRFLSAARWFAAIALAWAVLLLTATIAAAATVTFSFSASDLATPGQVRPGDRRLIATEPVAGELQGLTCVFTVTSTNGESVHVNNFVEIVTDGNQTDVLGTEDGSFAVHVVDRTLTLGPTIEVWNIIGERVPGELPVGTSVELTIGVTCQTDDTTTTTTTTTTPASSSTVTIGTTTSTVTGSTTSVPSTTSLPPASTTSVPTGSSTTVPSVTAPPTLPFTGIDTETAGLLALLGFGLVAGGGVLLAGRRA